MRTYRAEVACPQLHVLAEGPVWDSARERILWVDINAKRVHEGTLTQGRVVAGPQLEFAETIGTVACSAAGDLLVAGARSLFTVLADGTRVPGPPLIPGDRRSRLNDGTCDPAGRFLVGTMALDDRTGQEELVVVDGDRVTVLDGDLTLSNGLAFSPDGRYLYSTDTTPRSIWVRDLDGGSGAYGPRRPHLTVTGGHPDGMCADADGNLWVAIWGAGQVRCYARTGEVLATVEVAAPNTSSVAFVGPQLDTLLVTTASEQLTPQELADHPDSGKLFTASVGVTGHPVPAWAGPTSSDHSTPMRTR